LDGELRMYLEDLQEYAPLEDGEEIELARCIANGGQDAPEAVDRMIEGNLRLVVDIAKRFQGRGMSLVDLIGEGNLALARAARCFDVDFGTKFSTYAGRAIRSGIRLALRRSSNYVYLPAYMYRLIDKWKRAIADLSKQTEGSTPSIDDVVDNLEEKGVHVSAKRVAMIGQALEALLLKREPDSEDDSVIEETIDPTEQDAGQVAIRSDLREKILVILSGLEKRERQVVCMRHGIDPYPQLNQREIGEALGLGRDQVRQTYDTAISKVIRQAVA